MFKQYKYMIYYLLTSPLGLYREISDRRLDDSAWDFPVMNEQTRLISYLLNGLFIMELSLRSIKTKSWSAENF